MRTLALTALGIALALAASIPTIAQEEAPEKADTQVARFAHIDSLDGFAGFFNIAQGTVRIVSFLSPTCPLCVQGFFEVKRIMEAIPSKRLRSFVVFMPVLERDQRSLAITLLGNYHNRRASYFWDPNYAVAKAFRPLTESPTPLVSAYFLFDTKAVVRDKPDPPTLWLRTHEHEAVENPSLDGASLETAVRELLDRFENEERSREQEGE